MTEAEDQFIAAAQQRIRALAGLDAAFAEGFSEADLGELRTFAPTLAEWVADQSKPYRCYLEIKSSADKERLLLIGLIPVLAASAAQSGKKLLMLVAEEEQVMHWSTAARRLLGKFEMEIATWGASLRRLGGFGSQHGSYWFIGDIDTSLPLGSQIPIALGNEIAEGTMRLTKNRSANFILLHQVGQMGVQPAL